MKKLPGDRQVEFLRDLTASVVRSIVEHEDYVRIGCLASPNRIALTVSVFHTDMGLVLGERGATIDAVRRIVWIAAKKTDLKVDIDVVG